MSAGFDEAALDRALARGAALGRLAGRVVRYHRRDAFDALGRAFPERSPAEIGALVDAMYAHFGKCAVEVRWLRRHGRAYAGARIRWDGRGVIDRLLEAGRGALLLTAHTGNWELLCTTTPLNGWPVAIVAKAVKNRYADAWVNRRRGRFGLRVLPARRSYRACVRTVRDNGLLGFVLDQNMIRTEGVFVEFFGRPACTTPGLAHLAARTGTPVVPVFGSRDAAGRHLVEVGAALDPPAGTDEPALREATQAYTRLIEAFVRAHPEQWTWGHRRWRTKLPAPGA